VSREQAEKGNEMKEKPHKNLDAWKNGIELTMKIYRLTDKLPDVEKFGLISQMRRAAVSIPSNIAEGAARNTNKGFIQFLHTAQASLSELDTQVIICKQLGYLSEDSLISLEEQMERESKLISGLIKYLKKND
jgi:four helix bundle protein